MDMLHARMIALRDLAPEASTISSALDYSLKRWVALRATLMTGPYPLTTIGQRTRSGRGLLDARTGSSQGRYAAANGCSS